MKESPLNCNRNLQSGHLSCCANRLLQWKLQFIQKPTKPWRCNEI